MEIIRVLMEFTTSNGTEWEVLMVGEEGYYGSGDFKTSKVKQMIYHTPAGEGDAHYVDVLFENGIVRRIFRPSEVYKKGEF